MEKWEAVKNAILREHGGLPPFHGPKAYPRCTLLLAIDGDSCWHADCSLQCKEGPKPLLCGCVRRAPRAYLAGAAAPPRIALKNSDDEGSSTSTSLFLLKLAL